MIRIAWHGCAAYTLDLDGHEILVDPLFSTDGPYANPHAPTAYEYMAAHRPERVLITDGRADHCDMEAIRSLTAIRPLEFVCGPEVAARLARECGIAAQHLTTVEPGDARTLESLHVDVFPAMPPLAGDPGEAPLAMLVRASEGLVFVSGDTTAEAIPETTAPVAVLYVGTRMKDPLTQGVAPHTLTVAEVPEAARRLRARAVVPVEWDQPLFVDPIDISDIERRVAEVLPQCAVAKPAYNTWAYIETKA